MEYREISYHKNYDESFWAEKKYRQKSNYFE